VMTEQMIRKILKVKKTSFHQEMQNW